MSGLPRAVRDADTAAIPKQAAHRRVHKLQHPHRRYTLFKQAVHLALLWNVKLFFAGDRSASVVLPRA